MGEFLGFKISCSQEGTMERALRLGLRYMKTEMAVATSCLS